MRRRPWYRQAGLRPKIVIRLVAISAAVRVLLDPPEVDEFNKLGTNVIPQLREGHEPHHE